MNFPEKGRFRTMAIMPGSSSWLDEEDGDGSENSPLGAKWSWIEGCSVISGVKIAERKLKRMVNTSLRIEKLLKDSSPMGSGGKGRRKENKKDMRTTESVDNVATVSRQRRQKVCWYFVTSRIKSASARIPV